MRLDRLPLRYKLLLPSAVALVLLLSLAVTLAVYLRSITNQNEDVRQWMHALERMHIALSAGQKLQQLAREADAQARNREDIQFEYFEQFQIFEQHLTHPYLLARTPRATERTILDAMPTLRDIERNDPARVDRAWQALLPTLETLYQHFWIQRRVSYVQFYDAASERISLLLTVASAITLSGFALTAALSVWLTRHISGRVRMARNYCSPVHDDETDSRDALEDLTLCVRRMREQLDQQISACAVLEGSEDERRRIAMDLHDQTLADLTHLTRDVKSLRNERLASLQLSQFGARLDEIIEDIRRIMDDLHPQTLEALGLRAALQSYLNTKVIRAEGPLVHCHCDDDIDQGLTSFERLTLYRILLEAVNNAMRHAHCSRCEIDCRLQEGVLTVSVEDNGHGFKVDEKLGTGRGLANILRRAQAIGAEAVWLASRFSTGTRFELSLTVAGRRASCDVDAA